MIGAQYVSIHTRKGVPLYQYSPSEQYGVGWSREQNQVSTCDLTLPSQAHDRVLPDLAPWLHEVSVWSEDGKSLYWNGPITSWSANRDQVTVTARDIATLMTRTLNPITKRWDIADPADIAAELVEAMIDQHGLRAKPIVRRDPRVDRFDFAVRFEEQTLDQTFGELTGLGLRWSVVMGVPILGPMPLRAVAALSEHDFVGGSPVVGVDGADMATEVIVRTAGTIARARTPVDGLRLQKMVTLDSMFAVSNAAKAARQLVSHSSAARRTLALPGNIRLHPEAPVLLDQLIPSARFTVEAYGAMDVLELTSMQVQARNGETTVNVTMQSVDDDPPELLEQDASTGAAL